jgi:hypothetical protein
MIQGNIIVFIFVGLILSILSLLFRQKANYNVVPRKIWSYWDNSDKSGTNKIPKSVKLCMESWKKHNPDYEIVLLTKKNFQGYVTIPDDIRNHPHFNDSAARFSDLVRLYVLEEHGGIWVDASVLVKRPFDKWLFPRYAEFAGYYMGSITSDKKYPVLESWFLAANKNSRFIKLWKQEFLEVAAFKDIHSYLDSRKKMGINFEKIRDPHYLAIYIAALKVLQFDKYPQETLILRDSEEGPFKYLHDALWHPDKALKIACANKAYQGPLMKLRSDERNILEKELDYDLSCSKCGWLD